MLSEEHVTQLSSAMILIDLLRKVRADGHETQELEGLHKEFQEWVDGIMETLNEQEKNQAIDMYVKERSNGEIKSLPSLLAKFRS